MNGSQSLDFKLVTMGVPKRSQFGDKCTLIDPNSRGNTPAPVTVHDGELVPEVVSEVVAARLAAVLWWLSARS